MFNKTASYEKKLTSNYFRANLYVCNITISSAKISTMVEYLSVWDKTWNNETIAWNVDSIYYNALKKLNIADQSALKYKA